MKLSPQKWIHKSIQTRLVLLLLSVLIPILAIQAYVYYDSYRVRRASEIQANMENARALAKNMESFVKDVVHQELVIGLAITSSQRKSSQDISRLLDTVHDYEDAIRDFTWMNPEGVAVYSSNPAMVGNRYGDRGYFRKIVEGRAWTVGELVLARTTGKPVFGISRGIRDERGTLLGVVVATAVPEKLEARLAVERGPGGAHAIVDGKGMLVYRHPAIHLAWEERNQLALYPEYGQVLGGKEMTTTVHDPYEGKSRLVSLSPVPSIGWVAMAGVTEEEVMMPVLGSIGGNALLFLTVSFAAFLIALSVSRKITKPVADLSAHALLLKAGKEPGPIRSSDVSELRDLAGSFNAMAEKVKERETVLRRERDFSAALLDTAGALAVVFDPEGRIQRFNRACEELTGYRAGDVIGRPFMDFLIAPEEIDGVRGVLNGLRAGNFPNRHENHWVAKSGARRLIAWSNTAITRPDGGIDSIIATGVDITEQRRAEEALRKAKDELEERIRERTAELQAASMYTRSLIEASLDPLVTISIGGKITDINHATEMATGIPREQLIGSDFSDYFTEPEKARAGYRRVFEQGFVRDYPLELKHRDGHFTPVLYNASTYRDPAGRIAGVFAAARDITGVRRAEEAAMAERQRFFDVLETLPVYVILLNRDYQVPFANRFFRERFGESRGRPCYEYLFNRTEPCEICETYTVYRTGEPHHWEWTGPDGRNYDISDFPFVDTDGSSLIMEVGIDITEVKRAQQTLRAANETLEQRVVERTAKLAESEEKLRLANEQLEQRVRERTRDLEALTFELEKSRDDLRKLASELVLAEESERKRIAAVLHDEIAQTLAVARMRIDMLQKMAADEESRQTIREAKEFLVQSIRETRGLMNDIGNPLLFDMGVEAACESLADRLMATHPEIQIRCDIRDSLRGLDSEVKIILFQVVRELLNNVIKHSSARNADVQIRMDNGRIRALVRDDGAGFDPRMLGAPTAEGGYGLFSIRERLMAFDGELRIESSPEAGTVVSASLPATIAPALPRGSRAAAGREWKGK